MENTEIRCMKIFLAQQNYHIGNFAANTNNIITAIGQAKQEGADLAVFSELSVCGYPPRDFLEFEDFILQCEAAINQIKAHTAYWCNRWRAAETQALKEKIFSMSLVIA